MNSFDSWWNTVEGYGLRSERCFDDICHNTTYSDDQVSITIWMKACWNAAIEAAQEELSKEAYYWMDGRDDYGPSYPEHQIDSLKVN